jgi:hypothetical protein
MSSIANNIHEMRKQILIGLLLCAGCASRSPILRAAYTLEEKSGYSLLVPSIGTQASGAAFQTTAISLPSDKLKDNAGLSRSCTIHGDVFSLTPDPTSFPTRWIVKSLSAQGWESQGADHNIHAEWNRFVEELQKLEHESCFPRKTTIFSIRRTIAESIPLPASEASFFLYSFGGTGFVNLAPGMEIKFERPLIEDAASTTHLVNQGSLEADYKVVSDSGDGVSLRLSRTANKKAARSLGAAGTSLLEMSNRFPSKPMLRLFLQSAGDGKESLPAILVGADSVSELEKATAQIEKNGRKHCPENVSRRVDCLLFSGTAVSLMSSVDVNGKAELLPFGTSVGYMVDISSRGNSSHTLETVSLSRMLIGGGYANINFPTTLEAAQQIVLLPGDRLDWKQ